MAGCGWLVGDDGLFRDRADAYRQARLEKPLRLPEGYDRAAIDDAYPIPAITETLVLADAFEVPRPDPLEGDPSAQLVKIQRLGSEQWILVEASPGQVWPQLRGFVNQTQLATERVDAELGIIETGWLESDPEAPRAERYRFRVEQGVQRDTSEIFVLQDLIGGEEWPTASDDVSRENAMVQELSQFIANSAVDGVVSLVAERALDSQGKVFLRRPAGSQPYLDLQLPFVRAWGSLGLALEKSGLEIEDLNRSERRYYVRALPQSEEDTCGWFASLFGCDDDAADQDAKDYILEVQPSGERSVELRVLSADGSALAEQEAERLLTRIRGFIS